MSKQQLGHSATTDTRADFFAAISGLQVQFAAAAADIDTREALLKRALSDVQRMLNEGLGETVLNPTHPLARFMTGFNVEVADVMQDWLSRIETHERNTTFRKGYTDSLVIFVLGKVKAGKSSLGNYMAYGMSDPKGISKTKTGPDFFTAAMTQGQGGDAEAAVGQGGFFRVGARETTKSIQGFRVPGLTWVDSPGLHSVTRENGALASGYADVADLVIYPMSTSAPGRIGDVTEIQNLLRANKRILIVITQCDTLEEDEQPDGMIVQRWVMKDKQKRQGQIDYVRRAVFEGSGCLVSDILSISVRYAETHCNDPAALEESGMADLFRLITDIVQSEGIDCKRETPSRNLDRFVELVGAADPRGSTLPVGGVVARLDNLKNRLAVADADLDRRTGRITAAVFARIGALATEQIERHAGNKNQADFERECADGLHQIVAEEVGAEIEVLLKGTHGANGRTIGRVEISGFLKFKSFFVKIPKSNRKINSALGAAVGAGGGGWAGVEAGAVVGAAAGSAIPIVGTLFGAVVGAAVGALIGSAAGGAAGSAAGEALGSDWEETMQSGDNRADVEAKAVKALQNAGQAAVEEFFDDVKRNAIVPVQKRAVHLELVLVAFSDFLMREVHSNGRSVPSRV